MDNNDRLLIRTLRAGAECHDAQGGCVACMAGKKAQVQAADLIESLQAQLDATPTIHGKWKWYEEWSPSNPNGPAECQCAGYECSVCGISLSEYLSESLGEIIHADNFEETPQIAHCPSCGAVMEVSKG